MKHKKNACDGNDPNGFVGVGWSIMGIHDMGWSVVCYYVCVLMLRFIQWLLSLTSCLVVFALYISQEREAHLWQDSFHELCWM